MRMRRSGRYLAHIEYPCCPDDDHMLSTCSHIPEFTASTREPPILLPEQTCGTPIFKELSCGGTRCMLVDCTNGNLTQYVTQGDCLQFALRLIEDQPDLQV
jgi:hypothetical protein